ncbi:MAG: pyridoxal-phosphate dependent enzyme [Anaerolineales bacterium]|nr:pyridoxal-phosphate dependent enzyme [Anaerolineales bacterium]
MPRFMANCLDCSAHTPYHPLTKSCPECGSEWMEAYYDFDAGKYWGTAFSDRTESLWRYRELLPLQNPSIYPSIGEGWTPLFPAHQIGMLLGLPNLYIKDERQNPTGSFKDRQAAVTVAALLEHNINEAVICSTGNVAIAFSAAFARAGLKLWAFITSLVPPEKMHEVAIYGSQVIKVTGTYDQVKQLAAQFSLERGLYLDRGVRSITALESMKTIAFEIAEQLAKLQLASNAETKNPGTWISPDWYIQAVSGGAGPLGVLKGFQEMYTAGLIDNIPALACIQTTGCAPMAHAWEAGLDVVDPVLSPKTHITTLTTGDPGRAYTLLRQRMLEAGGGTIDSVSDEDAFHALSLVAKLEGLSIEPAAAVAFAGLIKLVRQGVLQADDVIVVNLSGHTMPVDSRLLGPAWSKDISVDDFALPDRPRDGIVAALTRIDKTQMRNVLIIDDQADARRLIRRILEAQGTFLVEEAASGEIALHLARQSVPDLIILDLLMPEMDGFALLDRLRAQMPKIDIPIIVVTAKELKASEWKRLDGHIERLMTKGDFFVDDLIEEIEEALRQER